jgi:superfamily II DNA helicase RecQ
MDPAISQNIQICRTCKTEKLLECFTKSASSKSGHRIHCKNCANPKTGRELLKPIRQTKEERYAKDKIYRDSQREHISEIRRTYRENNKEKIREYSEKYRIERRDAQRVIRAAEYEAWIATIPGVRLYAPYN